MKFADDAQVLMLMDLVFFGAPVGKIILLTLPWHLTHTSQ